MKQRIIPTSPKSHDRQKRLEEIAAKKSVRSVDVHPHLVFGVIVATLIFGATAGFLGFIIAASIPTNVPVLGKLNIVSFLEEQKESVLLSTRKREQSVVTQSPNIINHIVPVYSKAPSIVDEATFLGDAIVLSADGWMAMPTSVFSKKAVVLTPDNESLPIEDEVVDAFSGLTFFKVDAYFTTVIEFATVLPDAGRTLSVIEKGIGGYRVYERTIAGEASLQQRIGSTTSLSQFVVVDTGSGEHAPGTPLFYANGALAGVVIDDTGRVVSAPIINAGFETLVDTGGIERSQWDIQYVNLAQMTQEERNALSLPETGIYIIQVLPESEPEEKFVNTESVIQAGDVITGINSTFVDEHMDLSTEIHSHPVGDMLYMTIIRNGAEQFVEFRL